MSKADPNNEKNNEKLHPEIPFSIIKFFDQMYLFWEKQKQKFILSLVAMFVVTAALVFFLQRRDESKALLNAQAEHFAESVLAGRDIEKPLVALKAIAQTDSAILPVYSGVIAQGELGLYGFEKAEPYFIVAREQLKGRALDGVTFVKWKDFSIFVEALEQGEYKKAEEISDALIAAPVTALALQTPALDFVVRMGRAALFFSKHDQEKLKKEVVVLRDMLGINGGKTLVDPAFMGLTREGALSLLDLYTL